MLDGKVECSKFHWPADAGPKEQLYMRLVCNYWLATQSTGNNLREQIPHYFEIIMSPVS